jgi:hypothetical protein
MEDVASGAHAAIVKRDWGALQPLLHPYLSSADQPPLTAYAIHSYWLL